MSTISELSTNHQTSIVVHEENQSLLDQDSNTRRCCNPGFWSLIVGSCSTISLVVLAGYDMKYLGSASEEAKITLIALTALTGSISSLYWFMVCSPFCCENRCSSWFRSLFNESSRAEASASVQTDKLRNESHAIFHP